MVYFQNRFVVGQRFIYIYLYIYFNLVNASLVSFFFLFTLLLLWCCILCYSLLCVSQSLYIFSSRFFALDMIKSLNIRFMCIWETESNKWCYTHNYEWLEASKTKSKRIFFFFFWVKYPHYVYVIRTNFVYNIVYCVICFIWTSYVAIAWLLQTLYFLLFFLPSRLNYCYIT